MSFALRHALGLRQLQKFRGRLTEAAGQGGHHALAQAWVGIEVDDGVEDGGGLEEEQREMMMRG